MDADTKEALDAAADAAMREHNEMVPDALEFARQHRKLLTDGVCRITDVKDQLHPPCVGQIFTDLGERFPVFQVYTREQARALIGKRVKLKIDMSARGTRYVTDMMAMPVDLSSDTWPCPQCGGSATRYGLEPLWLSRASTVVYRCRVCLYQMEVGP